jgi:integrin beta 3
MGPAGPPGTDAKAWRHRRGFDPKQDYQRHDVVAMNGSSWLALKDDPGPLPGEGWALIAKGMKGEPGERGIQGPQGPTGPQGPAITKTHLDNWSLIFARDDGETFSVDLLPLLRQFAEEIR